MSGKKIVRLLAFFLLTTPSVFAIDNLKLNWACPLE
jgi:hypothetical protein